VFWAFPLTRIHAHAQAAAEEAETTAAQGRFWEMHDCLFEAHRKLEGADLERCAGEVCLDLGRFEREMEEHVHAGRVRKDLQSGLRSGVAGTTTFYVERCSTMATTTSRRCWRCWRPRERPGVSGRGPWVKLSGLRK
jgi:protein-disulfide isomerase